jgi:hypothetical protein
MRAIADPDPHGAVTSAFRERNRTLIRKITVLPAIASAQQQATRHRTVAGRHTSDT